MEILDHGFVRLVNHMGDDTSIVQAARTSTGAGSKGAASDRELIRYLMRHAHTSPLEFVEFVFHCKMPIFVARQWIRHRTASVNEVSGRYSVLETEFYTPKKDRIAGKGTFNKQGSEGSVDDVFKDSWIQSIDETYERATDQYEMANTFGIANELARITLPVSTYTEWYWKIDLHNLLHFLKLRMDSHAQYEIQVYANAMFELIKDIVPFTIEAFEDYVLNAKSFSAQEWEIISSFLNREGVKSSSKIIPNKLECDEFFKKLGITFNI